MTTTEADGASERARELVEALERTSDSVGVFRTSQDAGRFDVTYEELDEARDALLTYIASLEAENDELREAFDAAVRFIDLSPCDPDIYDHQWEAYQEYRAARQALDSEEAG